MRDWKRYLVKGRWKARDRIFVVYFVVHRVAKYSILGRISHIEKK